LIFAAVVLLVRSWLDRQETKSLASYRGHVPPRPWPAPSNPVQRPLHTAQVPPAEKCCGACDGSKCATAQAVAIVGKSLAHVPLNVQTRRNPQQPSGAYLGSYYGAEIDRILNSESPAPVDSDKQGREFQ
jgi:hypothetical protein